MRRIRLGPCLHILGILGKVHDRSLPLNAIMILVQALICAKVDYDKAFYTGLDNVTEVVTRICSIFRLTWKIMMCAVIG